MTAKVPVPELELKVVQTLDAIRDARGATKDDASGLTASERLVLVMLVLHYGRNKRINPTTERLGWETGLAERTVRRALRDLHAKGVLTSIRSSRRAATLYYPRPERIAGLKDLSRPVIRPGLGAPSTGHLSAESRTLVPPSPVKCPDKGSLEGSLEGSLPAARVEKPVETELGTETETLALFAAYLEAFKASHDGNEARFSKPQRKRARLTFRELSDVHGENAVAIIRRHFADPWSAKNRPQPWDVLADANKHTTEDVQRANGHTPSSEDTSEDTSEVNESVARFLGRPQRGGLQ